MIIKIAIHDNDFTQAFHVALENSFDKNYKEMEDSIEFHGIDKVRSSLIRSATAAVLLAHTRLGAWRQDALDDREYLRWLAKENSHYLAYFQQVDVTVEKSWPKKGSWDNYETLWVDTKRNLVEAR